MSREQWNAGLPEWGRRDGRADPRAQLGFDITGVAGDVVAQPARYRPAYEQKPASDVLPVGTGAYPARQ